MQGLVDFVWTIYLCFVVYFMVRMFRKNPETGNIRIYDFITGGFWKIVKGLVVFNVIFWALIILVF